MTGGRPQRGVDPAAGPLAAFAAELRALRTAAGSPTYRTMAARSGVAPGSLARTARGLALPGADLVRAYVLACGGDERAWIARWREMADAEHVHRRRASRVSSR